jgi:hypothetical protein
MIALLEEVLPWLFAFWLLEGVSILKPPQLLLVRRFGLWKVLSENLSIASLWPWGEAYCGVEMPFALGVDSLHLRASWSSRVLQPGDFESIEWPEPGRISSDRKKLLLGGRPIAKAPTESLARRLASDLQRIAGTPRKARAKEIRALVQERHSLETLNQPPLLLIKGLATLSFLIWFALVPLALLLPRPLELLLRLLIEAAVVHLAIAGVAIWILRKRTASVAGLALFVPPLASRLPLLITRELHASHELAAIVAGVIDPPQAAPLLRRQTRRAELEQEAFAGHDASVHFEALARELRSLLREMPAAKAQGIEGKICPTCEAEYQPGFAHCSDCNVALIAPP